MVAVTARADRRVFTIRPLKHVTAVAPLPFDALQEVVARLEKKIAAAAKEAEDAKTEAAALVARGRQEAERAAQAQAAAAVSAERMKVEEMQGKMDEAQKRTAALLQRVRAAPSTPSPSRLPTIVARMPGLLLHPKSLVTCRACLLVAPFCTVMPSVSPSLDESPFRIS